jgi:broad specificity phosphatase PhoE
LDTAKEIVKFHKKIKINVVDELIECSLGDMEGKTRKELGISETGRPPKYLRDTCESFDKMYGRADKYLHEILLKHKGDTVVFVGHGMLFRAFLAVVLGKKPLDVPLMDKLLNTSVTILNIDEDKNHKIVLHNCVKHLK